MPCVPNHWRMVLEHKSPRANHVGVIITSPSLFYRCPRISDSLAAFHPRNRHGVPMIPPLNLQVRSLSYWVSVSNRDQILILSSQILNASHVTIIQPPPSEPVASLFSIATSAPNLDISEYDALRRSRSASRLCARVFI